MLGIITKDLYQNFYISSKRMTFIVNYFVIASSILLVKNLYGLVFATLIWIPFVVTLILLQVASERDDQTNYYKILITMPITKKDIISARYILGLVFTLFNLVVSALGMVVHVYVFKSISPTLGVYIISASFILSLLSLAINYLAYIVLGSRGIFISAVITGIVLIGYYFQPSFPNFEMLLNNIISMQPSVLIVIGLICSASSVLVSYLISAVYYSKKEIN